MNAKFGISTQKLSKKVMSYSRLIRKYFFVDLCILSALMLSTCGAKGSVMTAKQIP